MGEINSKTKYYTQNESGEWGEVPEAKTISQLEEKLEEEQANYEAWQLLSELLEQAGLKLVPSKRTARKIADMRGEEND